MATATRISNAAAILACDAIVDKIDVGAGTAKLRIYDNTGTGQPADPDTAVTTQVLLAEFDLPNPAFGAASDANPGGRATAAGTPYTDSSANATGTASWFRVINRNGDAVMDGSVGTSLADLIIDNTSIVIGQTVKVNSWTFTMPET